MNYFVSDLHGSINRYEKLFSAIEQEHPRGVFIGGDLLPHGFGPIGTAGDFSGDFIDDFLRVELLRLRDRLRDNYPTIFVIMGNDDPRIEEERVAALADPGLIIYLRELPVLFDDRYHVYGYPFVPPTPFRLKDWEKYDVSRHVDVGCVSPESGMRTVDVPPNQQKYSTIMDDLQRMTGGADLETDIFLFHSPPYQTNLDRAALDGKSVDYAPLDVNVGSIAIRRFIEERQPLLTLHGHIHESARITGQWRECIGRTRLFGAGHHGPELALVRFELDRLDEATRELI